MASRPTPLALRRALSSATSPGGLPGTGLRATGTGACLALAGVSGSLGAGFSASGSGFGLGHFGGCLVAYRRWRRAGACRPAAAWPSVRAGAGSRAVPACAAARRAAPGPAQRHHQRPRCAAMRWKRRSSSAALDQASVGRRNEDSRGGTLRPAAGAAGVSPFGRPCPARSCIHLLAHRKGHVVEVGARRRWHHHLAQQARRGCACRPGWSRPGLRWPGARGCRCARPGAGPARRVRRCSAGIRSAVLAITSAHAGDACGPRPRSRSALTTTTTVASRRHLLGIRNPAALTALRADQGRLHAGGAGEQEEDQDGEHVDQRDEVHVQPCCRCGRGVRCGARRVSVAIGAPSAVIVARRLGCPSPPHRAAPARRRSRCREQLGQRTSWVGPHGGAHRIHHLHKVVVGRVGSASTVASVLSGTSP
jgi:hypothetical protein